MARVLGDGQRSRIRILDVATGESRVVFESSTILYEAPNWTIDGDALIVNGAGRLSRLELDSGTLSAIDFGAMAELNNDHVLHPNGAEVFVSADDGHIYRAPLAGGVPVRVTSDDGRLHYLHGVSPNGNTLAYIAIEHSSPGNVHTVAAVGGNDIALTNDAFPDDGCEYSPDGAWIYFNSERGSALPGHAQLFRMRTDGSGIEQLTHDERVNWFPHVSPDGSRLAFISFPPGTPGHPADRECIIRVCAPGGDNVIDLVPLFGGQGSLNVPSWSPDSRSLAFVDYPVD